MGEGVGNGVGYKPLKCACARTAGLGGKLSADRGVAPSVFSKPRRARDSVSRRATRCGRPLGYVKALWSKASLFPGSPAAILGGSDS